jgi:AcrR family transcriptional regulator
VSDGKPSAVTQAPGKPSARERILAAAVRQIAREGIDGVRIARIAMEARVSSALIHYHFATRDALLAEALEYSYAHAGEARIGGEEELPAASHAKRLQWMIEQCLPTTPRLEEDWVLWVELWLRAVRHAELRPVAEELYARLHRWFAEEIAAGVQAGEFDRCDPDEVADRAMALLDGYGIRTLIGDGAMPLERARDSVSRALARDLFSADLFPTDLVPTHPENALRAREPTPRAARAASRPVRTAPSM